ncbi:hypothetical protein C8J57DRAFT_1328259 [Mycena rebaudengoi]|nr:hypothetical protein C8J57DRAFT_1328259 [Mycena rebaudengoi]
MATHTTTYSEFFSSGLRAMAGTSYRRPSSVCSTSNSSTSSPRNPSRYSMLRNLARRSRTPSLSSNLSHDDTTSTRRERRSSILGLPSRLLDRFANIPDVSEKTDDHPQRSSDRLVRRNTFGYENKRPVIDPFDASPTSTSFFVDRDAPIARRDSFMLVAEPAAQRHSYFHFPRRRKSPASIHSLPLMPQSRRSSFQYRPPSWDKYDPSWALQEEEDSTLSWSPYPEEVPDPAAHIDWRQFHIDLLHEEA